MTTLALDLATTMGYALLRADGRIESGSERFAIATRERDGARWVKFRRWLVDMKAAHPDLRLVAWEKIVGAGPGQVYAQQVHGGFLAILQHFCEHHQIEYVGHPVGTIKKRWTGNGHAKKHDMIARCKALGFNPTDDNEADAIALLHVATDRVPPLPIEAQAQKRKPRAKADKATRNLLIGAESPPF